MDMENTGFPILAGKGGLFLLLLADVYEKTFFFPFFGLFVPYFLNNVLLLCNSSSHAPYGMYFMLYFLVLFDFRCVALFS